MLKKITYRNYRQEVLHSKKTVYLLFVADWCRECRDFLPYFGQLSERFAGGIKFCVLDIEKEPEIAESFSLRDVPTVASVKGGTVSGLYSGRVFRSKMDAFFKRKKTATGEEKPCSVIRKQA